MKESSLKRHRLGHPGLCRPLPRWPAATHMDAQPPGGGQQETGACAVTTRPHRCRARMPSAWPPCNAQTSSCDAAHFVHKSGRPRRQRRGSGLYSACRPRRAWCASGGDGTRQGAQPGGGAGSLRVRPRAPRRDGGGGSRGRAVAAGVEPHYSLDSSCSLIFTPSLHHKHHIFEDRTARKITQSHDGHAHGVACRAREETALV